MEFHIEDSQFKKSRCADRGHSLNQNFTKFALRNMTSFSDGKAKKLNKKETKWLSKKRDVFLPFGI